MNPNAPTASLKKDRRPTPDQMYLANKLNGVAATPAIFQEPGEHPPPKSAITPAALQKWNLVYGVAAVSDAMRTAWGFPPLGGIENPYAYVQQILRGQR